MLFNQLARPKHLCLKKSKVKKISKIILYEFVLLLTKAESDHSMNAGSSRDFGTNKELKSNR